MSDEPEDQRWICGKCEQEARGLPVTIPDHFRTCPKREDRDTEKNEI